MLNPVKITYNHNVFHVCTTKHSKYLWLLIHLISICFQILPQVKKKVLTQKLKYNFWFTTSLFSARHLIVPRPKAWGARIYLKTNEPLSDTQNYIKYMLIFQI